MVALVGLLLFYIKPSADVLALAGIMGVISIAGGIDYFCALRHLPFLTERALFFYWLKTSRPVRDGFMVWLGIAVGMGAVQLLLQRNSGFESAIEHYGLVFAEARSGQWWRLLTGPFLHSGWSHYFNNAMGLLVVGPILWALLGPSCLLVFVTGSTLGSAAQMLLGSAAYDSFVGVSGGLFAMYGALLAGSTLNSRLLPRGMFSLCCVIVAASGLGVALLSDRASNIAHIAGVLCGFAYAMAFRSRILSASR
jgi:membrane associated rhomboid family serine protease